ncbi:hypothetical protein P3T22_003524 [Paraburkholderia sp. GAS348]
MDDPKLVSPIIVSMRMLYESADIRAMLELMYGLYDEEEMTCMPPHGG